MQRRLRHLAVGVGRVALLAELDFEHRQLAHLLGDLVEPAGDNPAQLVGDRQVASLDLDLHGKRLLSVGPVVYRTAPMLGHAGPIRYSVRA